ncbi:hypothetical protein FDK21_17600 [Cohaesibacter sp. CAU 1516]|uniref:hypothetical protein n=1 Tax=Cohaesibacter sp. CAU 1516 TaxID=2576038 RepID=UPI0010FE4073|nr:hypothetical protein [Cohaesibacter sp. CAU 1516]TLP43376.1 hypothetical protein FDK21_17600 [Cohaesibacter sp. CAU 1516]
MPINDLVPPERRQEKGIQGIFRDPLMRLLAINWVIGLFATIIVFVGLILTNAAGLQDLIFGSDEPLIPMALLFFGLLITICSVAMGMAVMMVPKDDDDQIY